MDDATNPELESFRQQWRAEVSAKTKPGSSAAGSSSNSRPPRSTNQKTTTTQHPARQTARRPSLVPKHAPGRAGDDGSDDGSDNRPSDEDAELLPSVPVLSSTATAVARDVEKFSGTAPKEPQSALEHYEKAVEREAQGNLGDSLKHYRKAFRMDDCVDVKYRNKHFPPSSSAARRGNVNPSNATTTVPNPAHHSLDGPPRSTKDLISSFSGLRIAAAEPPIEGAPPPPCPIADMPQEILAHILTDVALADIPTFLRLAQVCKRLAYLVTTEDQIWKRICCGDEVGYTGMHYSWQLEVTGESLQPQNDDIPEIAPPSSRELSPATALPISPTPIPPAPGYRTPPAPSLLLSSIYPTYKTMFRHRPRLRFDGLYISTVNYMRAGAAAPSQTTWSAPVHIITYYRYLRFFRNGTVLSLLGTQEPADVVHSLLPALFETRAPASSPVHNALKGRWKLGADGGEKEGGEEEQELDESALTVETEGCDPKYVYRMELQVKGQERGRARLVWKGFWNWNRLTDDWGEFRLRNDKAFVFSKVHSYGMGA